MRGRARILTDMKSNHVGNHPRKTGAAQKGRHTITLELSDFAYAALRLYALDYGCESPEQAAFDAVRSSVASLTQISEEDFESSFGDASIVAKP